MKVLSPYSLAATVLFLAVVAYVRQFDIAGTGFEVAGVPLILYHLCRLALAFYLAWLSYAAGYFALRVLRFEPRAAFGSSAATFIVCFFLGASLYGMVVFVIGLAGLIVLPACLALTLPLLLAGGEATRALTLGRSVRELRTSILTNESSRKLLGVVSIAAALAVLLFVLGRVVYTATLDGNIWEHYLHYYRAVLSSGSTLPNEVWHHFYNSKGGGLTFLANVLGDFFGVQLVSACFVAVAGLVIFDLLLEYTQRASWALFGVALLFFYMYGDFASGALFRVHAVLLGYVAFAIWGGMRLCSAGPVESKPLMLGIGVSFGYLGFYLPVASAIFPLAFMLIVASRAVMRTETHLLRFITLGLTMACGTALALTINWILTGLPEITPLRLFWEFADREKVARVFGMGGIEFFLAVNNNLAPSFSRREMLSTIRSPLPKVFLYFALLGALILIARMREEASAAKQLGMMVQVAMFIVALGLFALLLPSPSVLRMSLFTVVPVTVLLAIALMAFAERCFGAKAAHVASLVMVSLAVLSAFNNAGKGIRPYHSVIYPHVFGSRSLAQTMTQAEGERGAARRGIGTAALLEFRRTAGRDARVMSLVYDAYDAAYAYGLPGAGIVSEPTYAVVEDPKRLLAQPPASVATYLKERKVDYLAISLEAPLFSTIAFTSLFSVHNMPRHLGVAYEKDALFILTWRETPGVRPIPTRFLILLELKRTGALHFPFSERLKMPSSDGLAPIGDLSEVEEMRAAFLRVVDNALMTDVLPTLELPASKDLLRRWVDAGKQRVQLAALGELVAFRGGAAGQIRIGERVTRDEMRERLRRLFQRAMFNEYRADLGDNMALLGARCDERFPFAIDRAPGAKCG